MRKINRSSWARLEVLATSGGRVAAEAERELRLRPVVWESGGVTPITFRSRRSRAMRVIVVD